MLPYCGGHAVVLDGKSDRRDEQGKGIQRNTPAGGVGLYAGVALYGCAYWAAGGALGCGSCTVVMAIWCVGAHPGGAC